MDGEKRDQFRSLLFYNRKFFLQQGGRKTQHESIQQKNKKTFDKSARIALAIQTRMFVKCKENSNKENKGKKNEVFS